MHQAYILLGSNIDPVHNVQEAIRLLTSCCQFCCSSSVWETPAFGNPQAEDFLNLAILLNTDLTADELKYQLLRPLEAQLGRVRSADKNASRTIDLDVIVFDGKVLDPNLWLRAFIALPMAEMLPDLINPLDQTTLAQTASRLAQGYPARLRSDIHFA